LVPEDTTVETPLERVSIVSISTTTKSLCGT
jgi:hypothetical protein